MNTNTLFATFYSFKGGVGRTIALVNTAVALTRKGHSVIIWDMDIEAPGVQNIPYFAPLWPYIQGGFVDVAADFSANKFCEINNDKLSSYLVHHPDNGNLRLLPAGKLGEAHDYNEYSRKFAAIEWDKLFGKGKKSGYVLFELIRNELLKYNPDFVLIDSRTGYTDIGGVCCVQLPHVVFLVFTYGEQNLKGTNTIHNSLANEDKIKRLRPDSPLKVYLVASMVPGEGAAPALREKRLAEWKKCNLHPHVEIPYNMEIAFEETVFVEKYPEHEYAARFGKMVEILSDERNTIRDIGAETPATRNVKYPGEEEFGRYDKAKEFDEKTATLFRLMGYEAEVNKTIKGSQIDICLIRRDQIESHRYIVECKDWERNVDKKTVDEFENNLKSVKTDDEYNACRAIIVAKTGFTKEAKEYAKSINVTLKTYEELLNGIINFERYLSYLKTLYAGTEVEKNYITQDVIIEGTDRVQPVFDYVNRWLGEPGGGFFTLLGDFGTGKTSFTLRLAYDLALRYEKDGMSNRVPLLINLKDVQKTLSLENIIFHHFSKTSQMNVVPETLLHLLKEGKIILIFDGFDEMATQTNAALTLQNFQELNKAFAGNARIILTYRTHYFKDKAQTEETLKAKKKDLNEHATELYKAIKGKEGYSVGYLQEFNAGQIRKYLQKTLPDAWQDAETTINNVYNLKDLSSRPVLLDMSVKSLPKIREKGGQVQAADLYAAYVEAWIDRDDWRLELTRDGRELLVEEIAERIWERNTDRLHYSQLGDILKDYLKDKRPTITATDIEYASSEVRTASFLTRDNDGNYGFAHRSFLEYFLARKIARKLKHRDIRCLNIRRLSKEAILFLSQIMEKDDLIAITREILSKPYQKRISENALFIFYWCWRFVHTKDGGLNWDEFLHDITRTRPEAMDLTGATLDWAEMPYMNLSGARLDRASLRFAILAGGILRGASFNHTHLSHTDLDSVDATGASFKEAICEYASLWNARLNNTDLTSAYFYASNFKDAEMKGVKLAGADFSRCGLAMAITDPDFPGSAKCFGMGLPSTKPSDMELVLPDGHSASVYSISFSPDGRLLASGSVDKTIRLWNVETKKVLYIISNYSKSVYSVSFSPDGRLLASSNGNNTIIWDVETKKDICTLRGHSGSVWSISFSPDGKLLATGSEDNTIKLWNIKKKMEVSTLKGYFRCVCTLSFSSDGRFLASGSWDKTINLWDVIMKKSVSTLIGHSESVWSVSFSPDGRLLASGSEDDLILLWDVEMKKLVYTMKGDSGGVPSVSFRPDGRFLATGGWNGIIKLWDLETKKLFCILKEHSGSVWSISFSPNGRLLASGSWDATVRQWDVKEKKTFYSLRTHLASISSVSFSPDGRRLASGSKDTTIRLWDVETGKEISSKGYSGGVHSVSFSPDGRLVVDGNHLSASLMKVAGKGRSLISLIPIAHLYHLPDGEWAAVDTQNRFVCSEGGRAYLFLTDRLDNYPATDFPELEQASLAIIDKA